MLRLLLALIFLKCALLAECADDLEAEIMSRRAFTLPRRLERDLALLRKARDAISNALSTPIPHSEGARL